MRKILQILLIGLLLAAPGASWSQSSIVVSTPVAGLASTSNTTSYVMSTFTPTAWSFIVCAVFASGTVLASPTMNGGSATWTLRASATNISSSGNSIYIFTAQFGAAPPSTAISFDCTGDAATGVVMTCAQFLGHNLGNPVAQVKVNTTATTSTNANFTFTSAVSTNNGYYIGWGSGSGSSNISTAPTSWTEGDDIGYATPSSSMATAWRAGGETTTGPFTFTNASQTWTSWGIEINRQPRKFFKAIY